MITLFSEEVETSSTNSVHNTLYVESFEEAFFGVYEFEINNTTVIAEQVDKIDGAPVVRVPVVESNGTKTEYNFILRKGSQLVELGIIKELGTDEVDAIIENASDTIKGRNTLYVDSFKETFFGVYEFTFNGKKVVAEKTDEIYSHPIVKLPVIESNGSTGEVEFILKVGDKDSNIGDSKAVLLEDSMSLIKEEDLKARLKQETKTLIEEGDSKNINVTYRIDKEEIIEEIKTDSKAALEKLREETKNIVDDVERIRDNIFIEFASNSDTYRAKESKKLKQFVDKKVEELRETNKVLAEKVEHETRNSLKSTYGSFIKKLRETQQELKERKKEHQKVASTINLLEKTQIELRDEVNVNKREILEATEKSEKSVNKALSRLGTVKKELTDSKAEFDTIKDALAHSIVLAEERVKEYYHNKIEEIENTIFDNVRRDEILKVVKESKAKILTELNDTSNIKEQLQVIASENYDPISGKEFQRKLKKSIDDKFASEMVNIRRMLESYGGGSGWGSEAPDDGQQYVRQNRKWTVSTNSAISAIDVAYDNTLHIDETHGLAATDVQNAIDELEYKKLNVADLRSNLMLFPTTASSTVSGYTDYGRLVTSTEDSDYDTTAVDIPTGEISGDDIPVGQLISDAGILEGNVGLVNITTIGNIRKTGVRNATFYFKVFKYNSTEDEVELCESNPVPEVTSTDYEQFSESALIPAGTTFTADDHIIIRYYGNRIGSGNTCTYEFQFGGDDPVRTLVPVPASTVVKSVWSKDTNDIYYNDGNVGIGTDSPTSKLDIRNGLSPSDIRIYGTDDAAGNTAFASLTHNSSGDLTISTEKTGTGTAGRVQVGLPAYAGAFSVIVNNNQVSPTGELAALIYNSASNLRASGLVVRAGVPSYRSYSFRALDRNGYPILVADGYKNVGIGTDSPTSKLHIEGSGDDDATSSLNVTDSVMNSLLFVRDDGNVGIGTTSPDYRLDIGGGTASTSNTLRMVQADGGTAIRIGAGGANNDVTLLRVDGESSVNKGESDSSNFGFSLRYKGSGSGNGNSLAFFSDNQQAGSQVEALTILQDGKVGIGTTTPARKLHVSDAMRLEPTTTTPASPSAGDIYFDSSTNKLRCYDGNIWQDCF